MKVKVLIIGGTKFIGKHIVNQLLEEKISVTIFSRGNNRPEFWDQVEFIKGDRTDYDALHKTLKGKKFDAVIDNHAYSYDDVDYAVKTIDGNIGHYILCSGGSVYPRDPNRDQYRPFREEEADLNHKGDTTLAEGKRAAELALWTKKEHEISFPFTIIRPNVVEGPGDPTGRSWYWIQRIKDSGEILVPHIDNPPLLKHVYVEDAAKAFSLALFNEKAFYNAYNISGEAILTLDQYINNTGKILKKKVNMVVVPIEEIRKINGLEKFEAPFTGLRYRFVPDNKRAREDLGYRPQHYESWFTKTVNWYVKGYKGANSLGYENRQAEIGLAKNLT